MIEKAPTLKISGKVYDFYFADFQNNGSSGPSTMTVGYVLKSPAIDSGTVDSEHIPLDGSKVTEIKIYKADSSSPAFIFRGTAVSSSIVKSTERNTLEVKYVDESSILDKKYVGLKGKFGQGFESKTWGDFSDIILVGKQVNPCDGIGDQKVADDRCSPCLDGNNDPNQQEIKCEENLKREIRDVVYTFPDLLSELSTNLSGNSKIKIETLPNSSLNTNYYARYTGTVREVLNNWCNDYGFNFYWDYDYGLRFVDLKNGIEINDSSIRNASCRILGYTDKKTIEDNTSYKMITYFGEDGKEINYNCNSSLLKSVSLKPLLLRDLVTTRDGTIDKKILKYYKTIENFYQCCIFSSYSPILRNLFVMYEIYKIKEPTDWKKYLFTEEDLKNENKESSSEKVLYLMGDLRVKNIFCEGAEEQYEEAGFEFFLNQFPAEKRAEERLKRFYFVIGQRSTESFEKIIDIETSLGKNFIGQYWYRFYSTINRSISPQLISPGDGSPSYHKRGDEMQFDFLKDLPTSMNYLREFISIDKKSNDSVVGKNADNFIMMKRAAAWYPHQNSEDAINFINGISKYESRDLGDEQIMGLLKKDDKLISFYFKPKDLEFNKAGGQLDNIIDKPKVNQVYKQGNGIYTYGLRSAKCDGYRVRNSTSKLEIYTPSQSFDSNVPGFQGLDGGPDPRVRTHDGYKIFIEESLSFSNTVLSNKKEFVYGVSGKTSNTIKTTVNYRNATQDLIRLLKSTPSIIDGEYHCEYSDDYIKELIQKFSENLVLDEPIEKRVIQYQLGGFFPSVLSVKDGLDQINIRLDGTEGFKTYVSFSNLPKKRLSESISIKEFEKYLKTRQISHQSNFDTNGVPPDEII